MLEFLAPAQAAGSAAPSSPAGAWHAAHPQIVDLITAYMEEALSQGGRGPADDMLAFRLSQPLDLVELRAPLSVWHGVQDRLAPVEDLSRFLGEHPYELRIMPGIGQFMILKHWPDLLEAVATAVAGDID